MEVAETPIRIKEDDSAQNYFANVKSLYVAKYVVQNSLWNGVVKRAKGMGYDLFERGKDSELPVVLVSFYDCVKFCNALNELIGMNPVYFDKKGVIRSGKPLDITLTGAGVRLPTSIEWETFAAGGTDTDYYWGNELWECKINPYAWFCKVDDAVGIKKPGLKKPNQFGLYDVSGNVCEWCFSKYEDTNYRILKGGSVALDSVLKTKFNAFAPADFFATETGFRIVSDFPISLPNELFCNQPIDHGFKNKKRKISDFTALSKRECIECLREKSKSLDSELYHRSMALFLNNVDKLMSYTGKIDWFYNNDFDLILGLTQTKSLVQKYADTKDNAYLDQWFYIIGEHVESFKDNFDNLTEQQFISHSGTIPYSWYFSQGFDTGVRAHITASCIAKILQNVEHLSDKQIDIMCDLIADIMGNIMPWVIKDSRSIVPNQAIDNAKALITIGYLFEDFNGGSEMLELGFKRLNIAALESNVLPDGGDMEQSYNYNYALCDVFYEVIQLYNGKCPKQLEPVLDVVVKRARFLKSISLPYGGEPATGTSSGHCPPPLYNDMGKYSSYCDSYCGRKYFKLNSIDNKKFSFTSIAFPYSGVYVLRNSFDIDAVYMWVMGARAGNGHASENINSFLLSAYGMPMIVNAGASWYGIKSFAPEDQHEIMPFIEKYKTSAYGENTLLIDKMGQGRLRYGENGNIKPYKTPIDKRFYTDELIDFTETEYSGIYYNGEDEITAVHKREVIFIKPLGIFVITDKAFVSGEHGFTLVYHIMPEGAETHRNDKHEEIFLTAGYGKTEINIEDNRVFTNKKNAPNFEMLVLGNNVEIMSHRGELNPCLGWFGGAIRSRRHEMTDIHVNWKDTNETKSITILSVSKDEVRSIKSADYNQEGLLSIITEHDERVNIDDESVTLNSETILEFKYLVAPKHFNWKEESGTITPVYT